MSYNTARARQKFRGRLPRYVVTWGPCEFSSQRKVGYRDYSYSFLICNFLFVSFLVSWKYLDLDARSFKWKAAASMWMEEGEQEAVTGGNQRCPQKANKNWEKLRVTFQWHLKGVFPAGVLRKYQWVRVREEQGELLGDNYRNSGGEWCGTNHNGSMGKRKSIYFNI